MAELVITLLQRAVADILHSPLTQAEKEYCTAPLPPPMVAGNYESLSSKCFVGDVFRWGLWRGCSSTHLQPLRISGQPG